MYKIVHYGDQPERTLALLNSYRSEFTHILRGMLKSNLKSKYEAILPLLTEKQRRLYLSVEAEHFGYGGVTKVSKSNKGGK